MTPDSFLLLHESISAHQTPSLHSTMPPRSAIINVKDEAPLHQRRRPLDSATTLQSGKIQWRWKARARTRRVPPPPPPAPQQRPPTTKLPKRRLQEGYDADGAAAAQQSWSFRPGELGEGGVGGSDLSDASKEGHGALRRHRRRSRAWSAMAFAWTGFPTTSTTSAGVPWNTGRPDGGEHTVQGEGAPDLAPSPSSSEIPPPARPRTLEPNARTTARR